VESSFEIYQKTTSPLEVVVLIDSSTLISRWSNKGELLLGWQESEILEQGLFLADIVPEVAELRNDFKRYQDSVLLSQRLEEQLQHNEEISERRVRKSDSLESIFFSKKKGVIGIHKDGTEIDLEMNIRPVKLKEGVRFNVTLREIGLNELLSNNGNPYLYSPVIKTFGSLLSTVTNKNTDNPARAKINPQRRKPLLLAQSLVMN
jgi:hypothetical protein